MNKEYIFSQIKAAAVLPLFYNDSEEVCIKITDALYQAGIRSIEFTNRGKNAAANFNSLVENRLLNWPGLLLGIGTIKTVTDATIFKEAKADFLVSPFFDIAISDYVNTVNVPWIPGCMTPGEIHVASSNNHSLIKLFPGNILTPQFISAVKPLFPEVDFMITGGVTTEAENIKKWFDAGAAAVGLGSNLIANSWNRDNDYILLTQKTRDAISLINLYKNKI